MPSFARAAAERQVRLRGERGDADTRQVELALVDDEPPLPGREELAVEHEQIVQLEATLESQQRAPLELLQGREIRLGREQRREGSEVERDARKTVLARPRDSLGHEPLVE